MPSGTISSRASNAANCARFKHARNGHRVGNHLSGLRRCAARDHADRCLRHRVSVHRLRRTAPAETRDMLRLLFLRLDAVPADAEVCGVLKRACTVVRFGRVALAAPGAAVIPSIHAVMARICAVRRAGAYSVPARGLRVASPPAGGDLSAARRLPRRSRSPARSICRRPGT